MINVQYRVKYDEQTVTQAEYDLVKALFNKSMKVEAIKFIRNQYNLGLLEAKLVCEAIANPIEENTKEKQTGYVDTLGQLLRNKINSDF